MKKTVLSIIAAALALVIASGLCACAGGTETPKDTNGQKTNAPDTNKAGGTVNTDANTTPSDTAAATAGETTSSVGSETEPEQVKGSEGLDIKNYGDTAEVRDIGTFTGTELVIPSHVDGVPVTHIDEDALSNDTMTSLFIPWTVTSIGEDAVSSSHNLETVTFSEGLIGIGYGSFAGCPKLKTVTLPKTLESVGQSAFRECAALTEVTLNGNSDINNNAFCDCTALTKVTYTDDGGRAYSLKSSAFESDTALSEVRFSEGLDTIGSFCFSGCSALGTVCLPASLTKIDASAFYNVGSLKILYAGSEEQWRKITVANGNEVLQSAEITYNYK